MPLKKCTIDGKQGWKWGDEGKCYTGPDAKEKAIKQGRAIGDYELESYTDYPQAATNNAKKALKWVEENGWGSCGTQVGKIRANQLANREPISRDTIARMASFKRHQQHKDVPYDEGCGGIMWDSWGGTEGINWAIKKLDQIEKMEKIQSFQKLQTKVRVGFDYDGVITKAAIRKIIQKLIQDGSTEIYVVTARNSSLQLYGILNELGIPHYRVFAVGSNEKKIEKVKQLRLNKFYDNNKDVIKELPGIGELIQ